MYSRTMLRHENLNKLKSSLVDKRNTGREGGFHILIKRYRIYLISLFSSFFLFIFGYIMNNQPIFTGENLDCLFLTQKFKGFFQNDDSLYNDVRFINVSFDKELINISNSEGEIIGNTDITDRHKLLDLLNFVEKCNPKYIILDIRFLEGFSTDHDKPLFDKICNMNNIVIAKHSDAEIADERLNKRAALADYYTTITATNFVRYEYHDSIPYIPLYVYNDIQRSQHRDTVTCHEFSHNRWLKWISFYNQGWYLTQNSVFVDFETNGFGKKELVFEDGQEKIYENQVSYLNMGRDYTDYNPDISDTLKLQMAYPDLNGNYVIIGNMVEDMHDTYAGVKPGGLILYRALKCLEQGRHIVSYPKIIFLLLFYYIMTFCILNKIDIVGRLKWVKQSKSYLIHYISSILGVGSIIFCFEFIEYLIFSTTYSFVLPTLYFSTLKLLVSIRSNRLI